MEASGLKMRMPLILRQFFNIKTATPQERHKFICNLCILILTPSAVNMLSKDFKVIPRSFTNLTGIAFSACAMIYDVIFVFNDDFFKQIQALSMVGIVIPVS